MSKLLLEQLLVLLSHLLPSMCIKRCSLLFSITFFQMFVKNIFTLKIPPDGNFWWDFVKDEFFDVQVRRDRGAEGAFHPNYKDKNVKNLSSRDKLFKFKFNCNRMENLALKITFQKYGHFSAYFLISFLLFSKSTNFVKSSKIQAVQRSILSMISGCNLQCLHT